MEELSVQGELMLMITLEAARKNCGYTLAVAAKKIGIHSDTLCGYEKDSSKVSREFSERVHKVYKQPKGRIFFGNKSEFFRIRECEG